jgi:hypothetical protein
LVHRKQYTELYSSRASRTDSINPPFHSRSFFFVAVNATTLSRRDLGIVAVSHAKEKRLTTLHGRDELGGGGLTFLRAATRAFGVRARPGLTGNSKANAAVALV